jgi:hypothetical protein
MAELFVKKLGIIIASVALLAIAGCSEETNEDGDLSRTESEAVADAATAPAEEAASENEATQVDDAPAPVQSRFSSAAFPIPDDRITVDPSSNGERQAFFGDLHVHTTYSFDAFSFGTLATPYDAYRYAKGEAIKHPGGYDVQLREPLDFYAVTDHAMFLGVAKEAADTSTEFSKLDLAEPLHNINAAENLNSDTVRERIEAFSTFLPAAVRGVATGQIDIDMTNAITRTAWEDTINAAEQFNEPGKFTTFVAYEYTSSTDQRGNLHRNVIFRSADKIPAIPFSRFHSQNPEGLWDWMDELREEGIESLAIPHNSNGSNGQMFKLVDWAGNPMNDAYAQQRMRNEPLVEITQVKGTSETHPALSLNDEWAGFEIMPYRVATVLPSEPNGSYVRQAYLRGLAMEDDGGENPYKFGLIGSSDTHTAAISEDESNYFSKAGLLDSNGALRGAVPLPEAIAVQVRDSELVNTKEVDGNTYLTGSFETWGASGLAAVWAEENTREAIYDAFRRRETFATSGPRIRVRFFGGFGFDEAMLNDQDMASRAYASGVAMGSDLVTQEGEPPSFILWATRDALSAGLQRLQIVKGWTKGGEHHEQVYDVACSDGGAVDPTTGRCPDNGAAVDLSNCSVTTGVGDPELKAVWTDPAFDPTVRAFYYLRVLENPTCRWSTWDALRAGVAPRSDLEATIQERAWSSPIWVSPKG